MDSDGSRGHARACEHRNPPAFGTPRLTATMAGHCGTQGGINRLHALADRYKGMSRTLEPLRNAVPRAN